jgi:hypothetical protein
MDSNQDSALVCSKNGISSVMSGILMTWEEVDNIDDIASFYMRNRNSLGSLGNGSNLGL